MRNAGIGSWPRRRARKTPDRVALVSTDQPPTDQPPDGALTDRVWTYRDLDERVTALAHGLRGRGIGHGDRVAYLGPNHPTFVEALFATAALGAVFVPLNTRLAPAEIDYLLADSGAALVIVAPPCAPTVAGASIPRLAAGEGYDRPGEPLDEPVSLDDPCLIMYTSGTTGRPKGAVLSHGNLTWNCLNVLVDIDLTSDEVTLVSAPLFHTAALNMTCLPTLLKGGQVIIEAGFDPDRVIDLIHHHHITLLFGVPTMYAAIAASPRWASADLSSVRTLMCGGAPVPAALADTYLQRGFSFVQGYGLTEAAPGTLLIDPAMTGHKTGSAGVPHFFTDVRITRPDHTDTAVGEPGEILIHGPNVMRGYWGLPAATSATITDDGWLHTGDIATVDDDGYATIVDRVKDVIISGGENIYPAEVENALYAHPDVAECAVIGIPDDRWGEVGKAIVVVKPGTHPSPDALLAFLATRLAKYKLPKTIELVADLPHTANGKVLKSELRRRHTHTGQT